MGAKNADADDESQCCPSALAMMLQSINWLGGRLGAACLFPLLEHIPGCPDSQCQVALIDEANVLIQEVNRNEQVADVYLSSWILLEYQE